MRSPLTPPLSILNVLRTYEELLRNFSVNANAQLAPYVLAKVMSVVAMVLENDWVERPSHKEGLSGPDDACVRATSVSRYREQTLNRYDQDRAPQEEHEDLR